MYILRYLEAPFRFGTAFEANANWIAGETRVSDDFNELDRRATLWDGDGKIVVRLDIPYSQFWSVNPEGVAAGTRDTNQGGIPFVYRDGATKDLDSSLGHCGLLANYWSTEVGEKLHINSRGTVLGSVVTPDINELCVLWDSTKPGPPKVLLPPGAESSSGRGINDDGVVAGVYTKERFGTPHGFVWSKGKFRLLGPVVRLGGINAQGDVVGSVAGLGSQDPRPVLFRADGTKVLLVHDTEFLWSAAKSVNDHGDVLGMGGDGMNVWGSLVILDNEKIEHPTWTAGSPDPAWFYQITNLRKLPGHFGRRPVLAERPSELRDPVWQKLLELVLVGFGPAGAEYGIRGVEVRLPNNTVLKVPVIPIGNPLGGGVRPGSVSERHNVATMAMLHLLPYLEHPEARAHLLRALASLQVSPKGKAPKLSSPKGKRKAR